MTKTSEPVHMPETRRARFLDLAEQSGLSVNAQRVGLALLDQEIQAASQINGSLEGLKDVSSEDIAAAIKELEITGFFEPKPKLYADRTAVNQQIFQRLERFQSWWEHKARRHLPGLIHIPEDFPQTCTNRLEGAANTLVNWDKYLRYISGTWPIILTFWLGILAAVIFTFFPGIDLWISSTFFHDGAFIMRGNPIGEFFDGPLNQIARIVMWSLLALFLVGMLRDKPLFSLTKRRFGFVFASVITSSVLLTDSFLKEIWGRARPHHTTAFGGDKTFTPALVLTDQCATNCSFVSGHTAFAFSFISLALLAPPRYRTQCITAALIFGAVTGLQRVMRGNHFTSDVLFAGIFTILIVLIYERLILQALWRRRPGGPEGY